MACLNFLIWLFGNCNVPNRSIMVNDLYVKQLSKNINTKIPSVLSTQRINKDYAIHNLDGVIVCPSPDIGKLTNSLTYISPNFRSGDEIQLSRLLKDIIALSTLNIGGLTVDYSLTDIITHINSVIDKTITVSTLNNIAGKVSANIKQQVNNIGGVVRGSLCFYDQDTGIDMFSLALLTQLTDNLIKDPTTAPIFSAVSRHVANDRPGPLTCLHMLFTSMGTLGLVLFLVFMAVMIIAVIAFIYLLVKHEPGV